MNIVDSCFTKVPGSSIAIRYATETNPKIQTVTYNVPSSFTNPFSPFFFETSY